MTPVGRLTLDCVSYKSENRLAEPLSAVLLQNSPSTSTAPAMTWLSFFRYVTFVGVLLTAIVVLSTSIDLIDRTLGQLGYYFNFNALAIAVAGLTVLTFVPMLIADVIGTGAVTSLIWFEFAWATVLWILWLSTGAYAVWTDQYVFGTDSCNHVIEEILLSCREWNVIIALSFINWTFLMAYSMTLLVEAARARQRGERAWTTTVRSGLGRSGTSGITESEKPANGIEALVFAPPVPPPMQI